MKLKNTKLLGICGLVASFGSILAAENDWAEGKNGATRDFYNRAALLSWENQMGDWNDAEGKARGDKAFSKVTVSKALEGGVLELDVKDLVQSWLKDGTSNLGFLLRPVSGDGSVRLLSRESGENGPSLELSIAGEMISLEPSADTYLDKSTYRSIGGGAEQIRVGRGSTSLLRFDLSKIQGNGDALKSAVLKLTVDRVFGGKWELGVFRCAQGTSAVDEVQTDGIASQYPGDAGIGKDPAVIFHADFEAENWNAGWSQMSPLANLETAGSMGAEAENATLKTDLGFEPLRGKALKVKLPEGELTALNTLFKFEKEGTDEPEEIYFRYYLRLADDWNQTVSGGKMPGISGTYGTAGWGGRKSNGTNGWSARGQFFQTIPEDNPLAGRHPIGTYCYHADMKGTYGDSWVWSRRMRGFLENNRWYCIEHYVKLNSPDKNDGILRGWVDGGLAFEKTDIRFRTVPKLKIEQVWMNVYHGGKMKSPSDQHLFIDGVVIARKYIGPAK